MTLLLIAAGVILTVRKKQSLFGNTGRSDIQLGADHIGGLFSHGAQSGCLSARNGDQSVDVMSFFMVIALEGACHTASRSASDQGACSHVYAARVRISDARDEFTP